MITLGGFGVEAAKVEALNRLRAFLGAGESTRVVSLFANFIVFQAQNKNQRMVRQLEGPIEKAKPRNEGLYKTSMSDEFLFPKMKGDLDMLSDSSLYFTLLLGVQHEDRGLWQFNILEPKVEKKLSS